MSKVDRQAETDDIIASLDVMAEYRAMGVVFASDRPRSSGMIECYARGREEKKPSAAVNVNTGRYIDKGGTGESLSLFDFAAKYGGFPDWKEARKQFADKAGVKLAGGTPSKGENPADVLKFIEWDGGCHRLADGWCSAHKKGASVEALKLAGARIAWYPCYIDKKTKERVRGKHKVIALPAYGDRLLNADPVAWVLWDITGKMLEVFRGKGNPPDLVKMKSVGPTRGAMMNFHALARLAECAGQDPPECLTIWKTAGPSDLLAVLAAILRDNRELLDRHLVLTNASSETGDVLPHQANLFAGHNAFLVHDSDEAGEIGATKWLRALHGVAREVRKVTLPYVVTKKNGKDVRDFLGGVPSDLVETEAVA